ncbi:MAG TPA: hypothetical protein GX525_00435 [Bacilli bacterium]|nr:hypothetical protein [Bacilli bacterium]
MRRAIASIVALGTSAMMIAMRDRKNRRKMQNMLKPMMNFQISSMLPSRKTMKRFQKRMKRTFA